MPEHLLPMSDLQANPSNHLMNYRMFFFHLFKASSFEASISFLRLCADKEISCCAPPVVIWHKGTICAQYQWQHNTSGKMHMGQPFGKVILICVKSECLKEPQLGQKDISAVFSKWCISKRSGPLLYDPNLWPHKSLEKVGWITAKYFLAWFEKARMSANVFGMELDNFLFIFSHQSNHMCSFLCAAHGQQAGHG